MWVMYMCVYDIFWGGRLLVENDYIMQIQDQ